MATNLMNVFKPVDLQGVGKTAANIVSLAFNAFCGAQRPLVRWSSGRCAV